MDQLTRCVIDEFVTSLWYSSITPDQEAPEELRILLNGVIAEVANRAKHVNLITLLSRYGPSVYAVALNLNHSILITVHSHTTYRPFLSIPVPLVSKVWVFVKLISKHFTLKIHQKSKL